MPKITKRVVDRLQPRLSGDLFMWDSELKGFGLRVKPSGTGAYLVQYRNAHGQTRRMTVGKVGTLTPEEARRLARDKLASVSKGADPSADRRAAREAITVSDLCDWYLAAAASGTVLGRQGRRIKRSTLAMDRSRIETHVKPLLGGRAVRVLSIHDIEEMQGAVAAGRTAAAGRQKRGGVAAGGNGVASRTTGMLRTIFEHAKRKGLIPGNPAAGARRLADEKKNRRLSADEVTALGKALAAAAAAGENRTALAAIRFLLLTGFRRMEALGVEHAWLDEKARCVRFPDTKSGAQVRVVGRAALAALKDAALPSNTEWLFPADRGHGHFVGVVKVLGRVCARAGLSDISPHTLRHTFASTAAELGFTEMTIAALLGHRSRGVTQRYVHLDAALAVAADRVADRLQELLGRTAPATNVVDIKRMA
jgi:integrase